MIWWKGTMNKIAILMSTYNGGKYISEQIESLQKQTCKEWNLYIRDDGSSDSTIKIIEDFKESDSRITLVRDGKNLKPAKSFFNLMNKVEADYYFFCDQDDYWLKNKLQSMLHEISKLDNTVPQVVYCNLKCVDQNLKFRKYGFDDLIGKISGDGRFIGNDMPGCVMLFNRKTRDLVKEYEPNYDNVTMHDWWVALVAQVFGQVHFLDERLIYYRQHVDNTLGAGKSGSVIRKLFQKDLLTKQKRLVRESFKQDMEFRRVFAPILPQETKIMLDNMKRCYDESTIYRLRFINSYGFKQMSAIRTFAYKWTFVFMLKSIL